VNRAGLFTIIAVLAVCLAALVYYATSYLYSLNEEYIIDVPDVSALYEISDGFVYFGRPSCPSCELFKPILEKAARKEGIRIYYFNSDYFRNNALADEDELQDIFAKYQVIEVPILIRLVNNTVDSSYGANFTLGAKEKISNEIREFITYRQFPNKYIPHYTLILGVFCATVLIVVLSGIFFRKITSLFAICILFIVHISFIAVSVLSIGPIMRYVDRHSLGVDPRMTIVLLLTVVANFATIINLGIQKFKKLNENKILHSGEVLQDDWPGTD
jgi:predicted bacteriocin transport accessory protein